MVKNKNEHQTAKPFDISRGAKRQCEKELKCYQCNKIYITNSFLKECRHHFCEECIYFWLSNSFSDYLFETYSSCAEKLSYAIAPYGRDKKTPVKPN